MAVAQPSTFGQHLRSLFLKQDEVRASDEFLLEAYLNRRDEAAFEALLRRHGPMVLGVCRRILGNSHDAEDAFQATFFVLVRKAASIRPKSMVGNWLYGVASRISMEARRGAAKRRAKEAAVLPSVNAPEDERNELLGVLDRELQRLPAKSRSVIVLSDLEGKTRKEVALQLGWPEGTVASRLARARARLAKRLSRCGLAITGGSMGMLLSQNAASALVPASLALSTVKTSSLLAARHAAVGLIISAQVAALTEGALKTMLLNKVLRVIPILLIVAVIATGTGLVLWQAARADEKARAATPKDPPTSPANGQPPAVPPGKDAPRVVDVD
ncbi:MAG TPA: sigma-70 family RNA polymerase sigma factor, partial [Gemmataceae bacterium]|nr:sigma-70 family RNA polymerase sigma factor [Gemmataceae bacterium]